MSRTDELKQQIAQIDGLMRDGVLTGDAARVARTDLEAQLLALVLQTPTLAHGAAGSAQARPLRGPWLQVSAFVLIVGAVGYAWLGNLAGLAVYPGSPAVAQAAASGPHDVGMDQIEGLVERLVERLKTKPDDAEGWAMLGRSYSVLGRHAQAVPAYRRALQLSPQDAQIHADLADALGTANGKSLDGEPEKLINQALVLEPSNVKALSLGGTLAFNRGDPATAARQWEQALRGLDPATELYKQIQGALDEARQRAGLSNAAGGSPASAALRAAPPTTAAADEPAAIRGRVSLSSALKDQVSPQDTVFIFARPVAGGKAPLAILRRQVKDLPLDFILDDSLAMSPALRLSSVREVLVGARVSKSGQAMPQAGDLQGLSGAVAVRSSGVVLEISETLR